MNGLRLASFGIRGFTGESLTPRAIMDFAAAFGTFAGGGVVLLGRDTRGSSGMVHAGCLAGLLSTGVEVVDLGICPTPLIQFETARLGASGAMSISGGHNGMGWNSITLIGPDGALLHPSGGEVVLELVHAMDFAHRPWDGMGVHRREPMDAAGYFQTLASFVDADAIRGAGFTVLVDPVGGAGCTYLASFADAFGLDLLPVNGTPSAYLARDPEPRPRNAAHLTSIATYIGADIGFVCSSDMGRMSLVTETGEPVSEEFTFPLIAEEVLLRHPGTVVANCCTTRMVDDLAARHGCQLRKTPVGQAHVLSALLDEGGVVGGEGNGSVAVPAFSRAFDGFLMMTLILQSMATRKMRASELVAAFPRTQMVKRQWPVNSPGAAYRAITALRTWVSRHPQCGAPDVTDGVRADFGDGWIHARSSRTEQEIRILSEAMDRETALVRAEQVIQILEAEC